MFGSGCQREAARGESRRQQPQQMLSDGVVGLTESVLGEGPLQVADVLAAERGRRGVLQPLRRRERGRRGGEAKVEAAEHRRAEHL